MSLRNFHVDGDVNDQELLGQAKVLVKNFVGAFRQAAANGSFSFGGIKLQDADLNRVHAIVTEIDSRRLFYACSEDEVPRYAMQSLYEARKVIRDSAKGVWANPSCERIIQELTSTLADFCTKAEKLKPEELGAWSPASKDFYREMTKMRLSVWILVATLKKKLGLVLQPRNLPPELWRAVEKIEI
jgi:hypothetical protein